MALAHKNGRANRLAAPRVKQDCRWFNRKGGCNQPYPSVKGEGGAVYHRKRRVC